jgi:hypothetical protein
MNDEATGVEAEQVQSWLVQTANCAIPHRELLRLFRYAEAIRRQEEQTEATRAFRRELDLALNSYCHICRIGNGLKERPIDEQTAAALRDKTKSGAPLTDDDLRLLAKTGTTKDAAELVRLAFYAVFTVEGPDKESLLGPITTRLTERQLRVLADAYLHEAIINGGDHCEARLHVVAEFSGPDTKIVLELAEHFHRHNSVYQAIRPQPNMSPEELAAEEQHVDRLCQQLRDGDLLGEGFSYRPSRLELLQKLGAAWGDGLWSGNFDKYRARGRAGADEPPRATT